MNSKLLAYLKSAPETGPYVLETLSIISDTFADVRELEAEYGLKAPKTLVSICYIFICRIHSLLM